MAIRVANIRLWRRLATVAAVRRRDCHGHVLGRPLVVTDLRWLIVNGCQHVLVGRIGVHHGLGRRMGLLGLIRIRWRQWLLRLVLSRVVHWLRMAIIGIMMSVVLLVSAEAEACIVRRSQLMGVDLVRRHLQRRHLRSYDGRGRRHLMNVHQWRCKRASSTVGLRLVVVGVSTLRLLLHRDVTTIAYGSRAVTARRIDAGLHGRSGSLMREGFWAGGALVVDGGFLFVLIPIFVILGLSPTHANIATDTDAASLLGDDAAERRALGEAWKLLGAEDLKWGGADLETGSEEGVGFAFGGGLGVVGAGGWQWIHVVGILCLLEKGKF